MSDPAAAIREWLDDELKRRGRGAARDLARQLGVPKPVLSKMRNQNGARESRRIEAHQIPTMVAFFGSVPPGFEFMVQGRGKHAEARLRHTAMYVANVAMQMSITSIARAFNRDRSTVSYACNRVEDRRDDPDFDRMVAMAEQMATG